MNCITTVIDENYMAYVPMFVWCCRKVYGQSIDIKLFVRNECPYDVDALIVPLFQDFPKYKYNTIALRFVVPPEHYQEYDNVYVTDIDIMIMPEKQSLEDFHIHEMISTGLCYSNSLRHKLHYAGYQSMSGLHFASRKWFQETENQRKIYYDLLKKGLVGVYREYDGVMLYRMAEKSGLQTPPKFKLKKRHHGIHLGNFRLFNNKEKWEDRIPQEYRSTWSMFASEPDFAKIIARSRSENKMIDEQLTVLDDFIKGKYE
jgi:hypothetical protein